MSRETEKAIREMQKFIEGYNNNLPECVTEKTAKTADDFLELAEYAEDVASELKYARKALKLDPDNLDAERIVVENSSKDILDMVKKLRKAVEHGTKVMKKEGWLDEENIGHFWGLIETRPYMRLRHSYMTALLDCGMIGRAMEECEEMIRLCENDNIGVRYILMHIYAMLEEETKALELHKHYDEYEETQMLLPLSVLYFKKENFDEASKHLKRLAKANKDTRKFFKGILEDNLDRYAREMNHFGYQPFTIEELMTEFFENSFLFTSVPAYIQWAYNELKKK